MHQLSVPLLVQRPRRRCPISIVTEPEPSVVLGRHQHVRLQRFIKGCDSTLILLKKWQSSSGRLVVCRSQKSLQKLERKGTAQERSPRQEFSTPTRQIG